MDLIQHFTRLFAYDEWANREILDGLRAAPQPAPRALQLMAHIVSSERLWMERLEQKPQTLPVWPDFTIDECERQVADLAALWENYLAHSSEADLAQTVSYRNSKGETWSSRKDDILMHLITHSAYHRGQIALTVRATGSTPAYTDFIHSIRQGFVK
ncbi:MAG: DinB family protein [Terriglobales bacterium]